MTTHQNNDRSEAVAAFIRMQHGTYVTINDVLIDGLGDIKDAVLFAKLMYWSKYTDIDGWFTKKMSTIERTLGLTRREQDACRKRLVARGLLDVARRGMPAQTHYRILWDAVIDLASSTPARPDNYESDDYGEPVADSRTGFDVSSRVYKSANQDRTDTPTRVYKSANLDAPVRQSLTLDKEIKSKREVKSTPREEKDRRASSFVPSRRLPIWERLDPEADRAQILQNKLERPDVPTLASGLPPEKVVAWQDIRDEYDLRHGYHR